MKETPTMVPAIFVNFFLADAGASAALLGLLFVASAVAPERIFHGATAHYAVATSALTALGNLLFIALSALLPITALGWVACGMSVVCLVNTVALGYTLLWQERNPVLVRRRLPLLIGSFIMFGGEVVEAVRLGLRPQATDALLSLTAILLAILAIGILRSWELLGARTLRFRDWLGPRHFTEEHLLVPNNLPPSPT